MINLFLGQARHEILEFGIPITIGLIRISQSGKWGYQ
jgi:hypothetical protein